MEAIPGMDHFAGGIGRVLVALLALLVGGTVLRGALLVGGGGSETLRERWRSLGTWWTLFLLLVGVVALGPPAVLAVVLVLSVLLLRETLSLSGAREAFPWAAGLAALLYAWAWLVPQMVYGRVVPVVVAALLLQELAWRARPGRRTGRNRNQALALYLGLVGPSFLYAVVSVLPGDALSVDPMGHLVLLLLLTELNDSAQAWVGRAVGRRRMTPRLSPRKTWEGFAGGVATTVVAAAVVAPVLTGWGRTPLLDVGPAWIPAAGLGLVVALAGVGGDLLASGLKRAAGVKDSGDLLPGHGGVLDRFDSLSLTAPVYVALTRLLLVG